MAMTGTPTTSENYILGHSEQALQRLMRQSDFWAEHSRVFFQRTGLRPGMRVLDLGSGAGDIALLAAALVGPGGSVLSVDRAPEAVQRATARAAQVSAGNVQFVQADINTFEPEGAFDAVIGRLILMYLPDPAAVLRRLAASLAPGGIVAFQEYDMHAATSEPPLPVFDQGLRWIIGAFEGAGLPTRMGLRLHALFLAAGLPAPQIVPASRIEPGDSPSPAFFAETVRNLAPLIERMGLATRDEIGIDTLEARVRADMLRHNAVLVPPSLIGAWARVG
jgi:SAM-dependent methyltransferase